MLSVVNDAFELLEFSRFGYCHSRMIAFVLAVCLYQSRL